MTVEVISGSSTLIASIAWSKGSNWLLVISRRKGSMLLLENLFSPSHQESGA